MQRQGDYSVVAVWTAVIGLLVILLCFVKVPLG